MKNNQTYYAELNRVNTKYQEIYLVLLKQNAKKSTFERLAKIRRELEQRLRKAYGDDLTKLNGGDCIIFTKRFK